MNTITNVKISLEHIKICQKIEPFFINFPEGKTFKNENYFQKNPLYFVFYCASKCICEKNTEYEGKNNENIHH